VSSASNALTTCHWSLGLLRLFTLLLILGVPVVIIVSWYHGARGQRRVSGTELMIIAILLAFGGTFLWRDSRTEHAVEGTASAAGEHGTESGAQKLATAAPPPPASSIAVLAFSDLSAEGNQGYFSDGIAEEILNVLVHVSGLKVASRTSPSRGAVGWEDSSESADSQRKVCGCLRVLLCQSCLEPGNRKVEERAEFERHLALAGVNQTDRQRRGLIGPQ
jgi:hypothetical protein